MARLTGKPYCSQAVVLHLDHPGFTRDFNAVCVDGLTFLPSSLKGTRVWHCKDVHGPVPSDGLADMANGSSVALPMPRDDADRETWRLYEDIRAGKAAVLWRA